MTIAFRHTTSHIIMLILIFHLAGCSAGVKPEGKSLTTSADWEVRIESENSRLIAKVFPNSKSIPWDGFEYEFSISENEEMEESFTETVKPDSLPVTYEFTKLENGKPLINGQTYWIGVNVIESPECDPPLGPFFNIPTFEWDNGHAIVYDSAGNAYGTGSYEKKIHFAPGLSSSYHGGRDAYVFKYDKNEDKVTWKCTWGGPGEHDEGNAIALDSNGHVWVTGKFENTAKFDCNPVFPSLQSNGKMDGFLAKFDAPAGNILWGTGSAETGIWDEDKTDLTEGNVLWATRFGGPNIWDEGRAVVCDGLNVYVAGIFEGEMDIGSFHLTSNGNNDNDIFIAKFAPAAEVGYICVWALNWGNIYSDTSTSMLFQKEGNSKYLYITGTTEYNIPGAGLQNKAIVLKVKDTGSSGNLTWAQELIPIGIWDEGEALTGKSGSNNIYVVGYSYPDTASPPVLFLADFLPSLPSSPSPPYEISIIGNLGIWDEGEALAVDQDGMVYVTGIFPPGSTEILRKYQPGSMNPPLPPPPPVSWTVKWDTSCPNPHGIWDEGEALAISIDMNTIYLTGRYCDSSNVYQGIYLDLENYLTGSNIVHEEYPK